MKNNSSIILLLLSVGLFYTFTSTQYQDVKKLQSLANEYRGVLRSVSAIVELRDSLLLTFETFPKSEIDRLNMALPDHIDTVRFALDLDGMASRYGIAIQNIEATTGENNSGGQVVLPEYASIYDKATISFHFISDYENFKLLLTDIERSLRIIDVSHVSFETGESDTYNYEVSVETYWLK